jgi:hypothetical protein
MTYRNFEAATWGVCAEVSICQNQSNCTALPHESWRIECFIRTIKLKRRLRWPGITSHSMRSRASFAIGWTDLNGPLRTARVHDWIKMDLFIYVYCLTESEGGRGFRYPRYVLRYEQQKGLREWSQLIFTENWIIDLKTWRGTNEQIRTRIGIIWQTDKPNPWCCQVKQNNTRSLHEVERWQRPKIGWAGHFKWSNNIFALACNLNILGFVCNQSNVLPCILVTNRKFVSCERCLSLAMKQGFSFACILDTHTSFILTWHGVLARGITPFDRKRLFIVRRVTRSRSINIVVRVQLFAFQTIHFSWYRRLRLSVVGQLWCIILTGQESWQDRLFWYVAWLLGDARQGAQLRNAVSLNRALSSLRNSGGLAQSPPDFSNYTLSTATIELFVSSPFRSW